MIAIVDDKKVRSQIEAYCRELDPDNLRVRFFASGLEFEQKYFAPKGSIASHPLNKIEGLEKFDGDQLDFTLDQSLVTKEVIPNPVQKLFINATTLKITKFEPIIDSNKTIFSTFPEDFTSQAEALTTLVPQQFKESWQKFWTAALTSSAQTMMFMKATNNEYGWFKLQGRRDGDQVEITIVDHTAKYLAPVAAELAVRAAQTEESDELQLLSEIDLIMFKSDCVTEKATKWIDQTWKKLKAGEYFPPDRSPRFVLLKFEDEHLNISDFIHPRLDDLIYLPLDRLIFLQKLEIIFALPQKATPSFLFNQEVNMDVEISKLTKVEKISDLGLAVRNPVRLIKGLMAHLHITLPPDNEHIDVWGKVIHTEPHPEKEHEYLVYFSFFGIKKEASAKIKKYLSRTNRYPPFVNENAMDYLFNPNDLFVTDEEKRQRTIVILDLDENLAQNLKSSLNKDIDQTKIIYETGYTSFINRYIRRTPNNIEGTAITQDDLFSASVAFTVNSETYELDSLLTAYTEGAKFLGFEAKEVFEDKKGWTKPFSASPESLDLARELAQLASQGHRLSRQMGVNTPSNEIKIANVSVGPGPSSSTVKFEIAVPVPEEVKSKRQIEQISSLDLVIVDKEFINSNNVGAFIDGFTNEARKAGIIKPEGRLKIIVTVKAETQLQPRQYNHRDIIGLVAKPIDHRQLSFLATAALQSRYSVYTFANINWLESKLSIHVAKDIHVESLSEFGANVAHPRPIAPGTVLYLRGGIFDSAPNHCLAARFYHCEEHPKEKNLFSCSLIYFGINDAFMKYARRWFRESYAASKKSE